MDPSIKDCACTPACPPGAARQFRSSGTRATAYTRTAQLRRQHKGVCVSGCQAAARQAPGAHSCCKTCASSACFCAGPLVPRPCQATATRGKAATLTLPRLQLPAVGRRRRPLGQLRLQRHAGQPLPLPVRGGHGGGLALHAPAVIDAGGAAAASSIASAAAAKRPAICKSGSRPSRRGKGKVGCCVRFAVRVKPLGPHGVSGQRPPAAPKLLDKTTTLQARVYACLAAGGCQLPEASPQLLLPRRRHCRMTIKQWGGFSCPATCQCPTRSARRPPRSAARRTRCCRRDAAVRVVVPPAPRLLCRHAPPADQGASGQRRARERFKLGDRGSAGPPTAPVDADCLAPLRCRPGVLLPPAPRPTRHAVVERAVFVHARPLGGRVNQARLGLLWAAPAGGLAVRGRRERN